MIIELAGIPILIRNLYPDIENLCRGYETEKSPMIRVSVSEEDIAVERKKSSQQDDINAAYPGQTASDSYLETLAVYRKIAEQMPNYDTVLLHGSAVAVAGKAYIFIGKSGTGKSTHARLWRELLKEKAIMVNDDKPLVKVEEDGSLIVYGTPWNGKHHLSSNIAVPVHAICALEQSEDNHICEMSKQQALPFLIRQIYRPGDAVALSKTLSLIDRMNVKLFRMRCNMELDAAKVSYEKMREI